MVDRYTKAVLTVIALCLVVLTVSTLLPTAQAQSTPQPRPAAQMQATPGKKRCVWSYVSGRKVQMGESGAIELSKELQPLSEGGWELKVYSSWAAGGTTEGSSLIFERCEEK